jgi:hypothetical protein
MDFFPYENSTCIRIFLVLLIKDAIGQRQGRSSLRTKLGFSKSSLSIFRVFFGVIVC